MAERFEMRVSEAWLRRVDEARGDVPRATWVKLAVDVALATPFADSSKRSSSSEKATPEVVRSGKDMEREAFREPIVEHTPEEAEHLSPSPDVRDCGYGCRVAVGSPLKRCYRHGQVLK